MVQMLINYRYFIPRLHTVLFSFCFLLHRVLENPPRAGNLFRAPRSAPTQHDAAHFDPVQV